MRGSKWTLDKDRREKVKQIEETRKEGQRKTAKAKK